MESKLGTIFLVLLMIASVIALLFFLFQDKDTTYYPTEEEKYNLTIYLNELGVIYYYSPTCSYCETQKEFINFTKITKVNILENPNKNIKGTPAFFYKQKILFGLKTYEDLKEIYGYQI